MPRSPLVTLLVAGGLAACAATPPPPPDDTLSQAEFAIEQAAESVSDQSQSLPLYRAEQKLEEARALLEKEDDRAENVRKARWLAEEAIQDARFAQAQAQRSRAVAQRRELVESLETLREETRMQEEGGQ